MKITWNNIDDFKLTKRGKFRLITCKYPTYYVLLEDKKSCVVCNEPLFVESKSCKNNKNNYCSKKCFNTSRNSKVEKDCYWCGNKFKRTQKRLDKAKFNFCKIACHNQSMSVNNGCLEYDLKDSICPKCGVKHKVSKYVPNNVLCLKCAEENGYRKQFILDYSKLYKRCAYCGEKLLNSNKSFCNNKCVDNYKYSIYINKWKLSLEKGSKGLYGTSNYIKRYFKLKYSDRCQECGWAKVHDITAKVPLVMHHVDGNCLNNEESNLELLCPNCHSLTYNFGSLNKSNKISRNERLGLKT